MAFEAIKTKANLAGYTPPKETVPYVGTVSTKNGLRLNVAGANFMGVDWDAVLDKDTGQYITIEELQNGQLAARLVSAEEAEAGVSSGKLFSTAKKPNSTLSFSNAGIYSALDGEPSEEVGKIVKKKYQIMDPIAGFDGDDPVSFEEALENGWIEEDAPKYFPLAEEPKVEVREIENDDDDDDDGDDVEEPVTEEAEEVEEVEEEDMF